MSHGVYEMKPSPGFDAFGRCMGCGHSATSTLGHMCMVPVSPQPKRRQFLVTIEEIPAEPYRGIQTTTHPGYEIVWGGTQTFS